MIRVAVIASTPMTLAGLHTMLHSSEVDVVASSSVHDNLDLTDVDVIVINDDQQVESIVFSVEDTRAMSLVVLTTADEKMFTILRNSRLRGWSILPPSTSATQLNAAVVATTQGLVTYSTDLLEQLLKQKMMTIEPLSLASSTISETLTPREREVLELVSQGLSNKLIARSLSISDHTVKFHISSITAKLGASSRTDAVRLGLHKGFITL